MEFVFHTLLKEETRTRILRMTPPGMLCFVQYLTGMCIQGASLRRWLVPPATLARKKIIEQNFEMFAFGRPGLRLI